MKRKLILLIPFILLVFDVLSFAQINDGYKNFKVAIYVRAYELKQMNDLTRLESIWNTISNQVHVDKIYLETHRDQIIVDKQKIEKARNFFNSHGVKTAGGITLTVSEMNRFETFCYSNPERENHNLTLLLNHTVTEFLKLSKL